MGIEETGLEIRGILEKDGGGVMIPTNYVCSFCTVLFTVLFYHIKKY